MSAPELREAAEETGRLAQLLEALKLLREASHEVFTCAQVLIEFWAVATRPRDVNGLGMTVADTDRELTDIEDLFDCLPEPPDAAKRWRELARKHSVQGRQAHDARIVALMLAHNVTHLLTLNTADFSRYPEITTVTPSESLKG